MTDLSIAIAGGSIGGLAAGLSLRHTGCAVDVFERTRDRMKSRGAGIVVQPEILAITDLAGAALPVTTCTHRQFLYPAGGSRLMPAPQQFTSWDSIYSCLRNAFPDDHYHQGAQLIGSRTTSGTVTAEFESRGEVRVDLLVCADGGRSEARERLLGEEASRSYAGYVAWRGTIEEPEAPTDLLKHFADRFSFCEARSGGHILAYLIPGNELGTRPGTRRLNWVWYVHVPDGAELRALLTDRSGRTRDGSVPSGYVSRERIAEAHARARDELHPAFAELVLATPEPFIQTIEDVSTPRMVVDRAVLIGDAAFVVRPHTAAGTSKAIGDGMRLAAWLAQSPTLDVGLMGWQRERLEVGQALSRHGRSLARRHTTERAPREARQDTEQQRVLKSPYGDQGTRC